MPIKPIRRAAAVAGGVAALIAATAPPDPPWPPAIRPARLARHGPRTGQATCCCSRSTACTSPTSPGTSQHHPHSALAGSSTRRRVHRGADPVPVGLVPGHGRPGHRRQPATTGVYYDDTFNHALLPGRARPTAPGRARRRGRPTSSSSTRTRSHSTPARACAGLPGSILRMTGNPHDVDRPDAAAGRPDDLQAGVPAPYLKVNTIFEVARAAGLRTAWSDKHPAYEILNGPSGTGVQDLFTPGDQQRRARPPARQRLDHGQRAHRAVRRYKVQAVSTRSTASTTAAHAKVGAPAIFGMNFQTVSTAEKLPDLRRPRPAATCADGVHARARCSAGRSTTSTTDRHWSPRSRRRAWPTAPPSSCPRSTASHPPTRRRSPGSPTARSSTRSMRPGPRRTPRPRRPRRVLRRRRRDADLAQRPLRRRHVVRQGRSCSTTPASGNDINGNSKPYTHSGLTRGLRRAAAAGFFGVRPATRACPDVIGIAQDGVVYTGGRARSPSTAATTRRTATCRSSSSGARPHARVGTPVETTQIAPTILRLLGLNPSPAGRPIEHTRVLPGLTRPSQLKRSAVASHRSEATALRSLWPRPWTGRAP